MGMSPLPAEAPHQPTGQDDVGGGEDGEEMESDAEVRAVTPPPPLAGMTQSASANQSLVEVMALPSVPIETDEEEDTIPLRIKRRAATDKWMPVKRHKSSSSQEHAPESLHKAPRSGCFLHSAPPVDAMSSATSRYVVTHSHATSRIKLRGMCFNPKQGPLRAPRFLSGLAFWQFLFMRDLSVERQTCDARTGLDVASFVDSSDWQSGLGVVNSSCLRQPRRAGTPCHRLVLMALHLLLSGHRPIHQGQPPVLRLSVLSNRFSRLRLCLKRQLSPQ